MSDKIMLAKQNRNNGDILRTVIYYLLESVLLAITNPIYLDLPSPSPTTMSIGSNNGTRGINLGKGKGNLCFRIA
jgi:hypothetical protein